MVLENTVIKDFRSVDTFGHVVTKSEFAEKDRKSLLQLIRTNGDSLSFIINTYSLIT